MSIRRARGPSGALPGAPGVLLECDPIPILLRPWAQLVARTSLGGHFSALGGHFSSMEEHFSPRRGIFPHRRGIFPPWRSIFHPWRNISHPWSVFFIAGGEFSSLEVYLVALEGHFHPWNTFFIEAVDKFSAETFFAASSRGHMPTALARRFARSD